MINSPIIGIIGGAGVAASIEILHRFEMYYIQKGAQQNQEHPEIIMYQATQAPSRSLYLEGKGESFIPYYVEAAIKLKRAGASFLCIACNTAHYAIEEISSSANIPIINLLEITAQHISNVLPNGGRIMILCSEGSARYKIFNPYIFKYCTNVQLVYPNCDQQKLINQVIKSVKTGGAYVSNLSPNHPITLLKQVFNNTMLFDYIVIGCTELSLAVKEYEHQKFIDTADLLVYSSAELYQTLKIKSNTNAENADKN